ncbi:DUF3617 domain-containing protein [Massilia sp. UMI-21]|nr:DUF3617 domain-containing protein [Massilia sp. UMI-21]
MRTRLIALPLFALAGICASNAAAQQVNIKPGLWQFDMTMPGQAKGNPMAAYVGQMKEQMASMPPEQRKRIASTLAELEARGTEFTSEGVRTKTCVTRENLANLDFLGNKGTESCTRKASPLPGGMQVSMHCTRPRMSIEASLKYQGEKAYTFESLTTVTGPDGKPMTHKTSGSGKWLSSDCGKIKPTSVAE